MHVYFITIMCHMHKDAKIEAIILLFLRCLMLVLLYNRDCYGIFIIIRKLELIFLRCIILDVIVIIISPTIQMLHYTVFFHCTGVHCVSDFLHAMKCVSQS